MRSYPKAASQANEKEPVTNQRVGFEICEKIGKLALNQEIPGILSAKVAIMSQLVEKKITARDRKKKSPANAKIIANVPTYSPGIPDTYGGKWNELGSNIDTNWGSNEIPSALS